ncbi:hypothetical protein [Paenibacillus antarcticus]|uniref:Uncharacterized protein n=1 Tax=Paenibacillus antarcticus TaxID=253703 RepID=A0A162MD04_9BACL|nr:hypothetical protein [Paenibacillus antarcticus]OAB42343.1 hypothetical protein PBAT_20300 [Paenibacillus antarcticus]
MIIRATRAVFYMIHKGNATTLDYLKWACRMMEDDQESKSLYMLASMEESENIFKYQDYFNRSLSELGITIPDFEDCAREIIRELCLEIVNKTRDPFEVTRDIFKVTIEIDYPADLSVWINLDDGIDRITYDDEYYRPDERELKEQIELEAKNYSAAQDVENIR